jgi:heat shock protein HslJ
MRIHQILLPALLISSTMACTPGAAVMPETTSVAKLNGTAWELTSLPGRSPTGDHAATLSFEGDRAQGSDGCNRFSTSFTQNGPALEFRSPGISTQMACPPDITEQAAAFRAALGDTRSYRLVNGQLELLASGGRSLATFSPQATTLAGTSWNAVAINNGKQAVASLVSGSSVTLEFSADGKASGSAGCNRYHATYQQERSKLQFGTAATTRMACAGPELMDQEQNFLKALESVASARFEGDRLELRDAAGAIAMVARRTTPP